MRHGSIWTVGMDLCGKNVRWRPDSELCLLSRGDLSGHLESAFRAVEHLFASVIIMRRDLGVVKHPSRDAAQFRKKHITDVC